MYMFLLNRLGEEHSSSDFTDCRPGYAVHLTLRLSREDAHAITPTRVARAYNYGIKGPWTQLRLR